MTGGRQVWKRRALLAGGVLAVAAWVKGAPHLASLGAPDLAYTPVAGLAPFRRLSTGGTTSGGAVFAGLDGPAPVSARQAALAAAVRADPCAALYGRGREGAESTPVPVAMFSDFACPICKVMDQRLLDLQQSAPDSFRIIRHELAILGAASETASRAVLAAARQGAYSRMHDRLSRTPAVTDQEFVVRIAQDLGLDGDRFRADMTSEGVAQELRRTKAIATVFGFFGTPAFAIGRTVFSGSVPRDVLREIIASEDGFRCPVI